MNICSDIGNVGLPQILPMEIFGSKLTSCSRDSTIRLANVATTVHSINIYCHICMDGPRTLNTPASTEWGCCQCVQSQSSLVDEELATAGGRYCRFNALCADVQTLISKSLQAMLCLES
ncbi:hypothetical protein BLOT_006224 [Blomia tropicalis]|nr:hypothetical protein BLOT_006224 [Blomia tropicalis]